MNDFDDRSLRWQVSDTRAILKTPIFDLRENSSVAPNGLTGTYYVLDAPDWVVVVPEHAGDFLMVRQWRHGVGCISLEFPGGMVGKKENPAAAAARELEEETGYRAETLIKLGELSPNPALFSNRLYIYLATDLNAKGSQQLDSDEFIHCLHVPIEKVIQEFGTGAYLHAYTGTALALYLRQIK